MKSGGRSFEPGHGISFFDFDGVSSGGLYVSDLLNVSQGSLDVILPGALETPSTGNASIIANRAEVGGAFGAALSVRAGARVTVGDPTIDPIGIQGLSVGNTGPGSVLVEGSGSFVHVPHVLSVGSDNSGVFEVRAGGQVLVEFLGLVGGPTGSGGVFVTDGGSRLETIGQFQLRQGENLLEISRGGEFRSGNFVGIGTGGVLPPGGEDASEPLVDEVLVDGPGSRWLGFNNSFVRLGDTNNAVLRIQRGAVVDIPNLIIAGNGASGEIEVLGGGVLNSGQVRLGDSGSNGSLSLQNFSSARIGGLLAVGSSNNGDGSLLLSSGSSLATTRAEIGVFSGSTGSAVLSGSGTIWQNDDVIELGRAGNGTLEISANATLETARLLVGEGGVDANGRLSVSGENTQVVVGQDVVIGGLGAGVVVLSQLGSIEAGTGITIGGAGALQGDGQLIGNTQNSGQIDPGEITGAIRISGDFQQTQDGTIEVELSSPTDFDKLIIDGTATLDGALEITLIDDFTPSIGNAFRVLEASAYSNEFASVILPDLPTGLFWDTSALNSSGLLTIANLPGDYNNDGIVNLADYTVWRDNLGASAGTLLNDADGGIIGIAQYETFVSNFGATLPARILSATQSIAVPEPVSLILALFSCLFVTIKNRDYASRLDSTH